MDETAWSSGFSGSTLIRSDTEVLGLVDHLVSSRFGAVFRVMAIANRSLKAISLVLRIILLCSSEAIHSL